MIGSGLLNRVVVFQSKTETSDGMGAGGTATWADALTTRAAIWPMKADERIESGRNVNNITYRIRTRYNSSLKSSMRIKFGSRYFEILSMRNIDEMNRVLEFTAEEKV